MAFVFTGARARVVFFFFFAARCQCERSVALDCALWLLLNEPPLDAWYPFRWSTLLFFKLF